MTTRPSRCLILACGNLLREDDGIGPWLAEWAANRFKADPRVTVISRPQWTPEQAQDIAIADYVMFIDSSVTAPAGQVTLTVVIPAASFVAHATHHLDASHLLALAHQLYNQSPRSSSLLTVGAGSLELREGFSDLARAALPKACKFLESTVLNHLNSY